MTLPLLLTAAAFVYMAFGDYINTDFIHQQSANFRAYYAQHPLLTPTLFTLFFIIYIGAAIPGGQLMPIAAGLFFNYPVGVAASLAGYAVGPVITFIIARYGAGGYLQKRYANKLAAFNRGFEKDGVWYIFILRHLPLPFFLVNICIGLTSISLIKYSWVNLLSLTPHTVAYVYFGTALTQVDQARDFFTPQFFTALILITALPPIALKLIVNAIRRHRSNMPAAAPNRTKRG